jgi:hypothetical protein
MSRNTDQVSTRSKPELHRSLRSARRVLSNRYLDPNRNSPVPLRVGIAYELQEFDRMQKNNWDIPLHGLVNEHGWFTFDDQEL